MADLIFYHKEQRDNGDVIEVKILKVQRSSQTPEGVSYSCVYIRNEKRLVGYDNFEGHEGMYGYHHRHIKDQITHYNFVDEWKLIEDFMLTLKKLRRASSNENQKNEDNYKRNKTVS